MSAWSRAVRLMAAFAVVLLALGGAQAQTIRRITSPGKFYVDDKQGAGIVYNYAVYTISNSTAGTIPSAYVALTNLISTNMISLAANDTGIRALGALAPGQTKLAAFFLKGPSFTGNSDTLLNTTNETHTIRVYDGVPGIGTALVSSNYSFTNIIFVIEALANKITIITNLNPIAPLGSDVDLVIGGETGTIGGNNSLSFSPGVFGSWRPDAYELVKTVVRFTENPSYTNQLYFDPTISGFTNYTGQAYTNTFSFRAVKVTGTNLPVSPFVFVDSGAGTKHTAVSTLTAGGGSNLIYSAINQVAIVSQTVTPTSLLAPGGTVTYSITFSNYAATVSLSEIRDSLPGFPGNVTYIPGSATYNALPISDPSILGQELRWALPFTIVSNSTATLTFQATAPLPAGQYTNSVTAILGAEQIDTTLLTTDNSPSLSVLTVVAVSDMGVGKTGPANIFASSNFTYTISVTNFGPSPNTSFAVTDSLPASVTFVSATPPASVSGNLVTWTNLGTFAVNATTNLTITVTAPANAAGLTNTATVGGPISDPNSTNNVTPPVVTTSVTNRPPVAVNDTTPGTLNVQQVFNPLTNDSDPDGDTITLQSVSYPGGIISINSGATNITFTPTNNNASLITYTIVDTRGGTSTATITVTGFNQPPAAGNQNISINEDSTTNLVLTATDDGTNLTYSILSGPANGALTGFNGTSGAVIYTPATNYIGADSFTFTVNDGFLSSTGTVSITVSAINDPPIANNQTFTMPEDTSTNVVLTASDVDSTNLVFAILVGPTNGTLGVLNPNTGVVSFTPNTNFAGNDGFTFTVFDGQYYSTGSVFSITVNPLNDAPLANSQNVTNNEDTVFGITLTGSDVDGPVTNFVLVSLPTNGTLSGSGANLTYTPTNNYNGPDSFTFTVNDGSLTSAVATVSITLLAVNDPPVIVNDQVTVNEDTTNSIPVLVNDSDPDGNPLTLVSVNTTNGNATVVGTNVVYTPSPNFNGTNTLTYCATDGVVTNCASITVIVTPVNDAPIANSQSVTNNEDTAFGITLTGSDVDGPATNFVLASLPLHGLLSGSGANLTYTPTNNYNGPDSFTFTVNDGSLTSAVATVSITINAVNDAPVAANDSYSFTKNVTFNEPVSGVLGNDSDVDGNALTAVLATTTTNGTLTLNTNGSFSYVPTLNFVGVDTFTYRARDGTTNSGIATVTLNILATNSAPIAVNDFYPVNEDSQLVVPVSGVLTNDTDVDATPLTAVLVATTTNGTLNLAGNGSFTYTPNTNFVGVDTFTYRADDGSLTSGIATVTITINAVNDSPVATNLSVTLPEDSTTNLVLTASDVDNTNLVFAILTNPGNGSLGTLNTNTGAVTYSPNANFNGGDSFTFRVFDGSLYATGTVAITVTPLNDPPVIVNDQVTVNEDSTNSIPVLVNDTDPDGNPLTLVSVSTTNGNATVVGTNVVYTPSPDFNGTNTLTYCATDGLVTNCASITVIVSPVNDAPIANNQIVGIPEDNLLNVVVTGTDIDSTNLVFAILTAPVNGALGAINPNSGAVTYLPSTNYVGPDSFTFTVSDGSLLSTGTVSITVGGVNDNPLIVADLATVNEDSIGNIIHVLVNDFDIDGDTISLVSVNTTNGTAIISGTNVVYTPSANFNGTNVMTYCATDGDMTNCASITVTVLPVNDAPLANDQSVTVPYGTPANLTLAGSDVDNSSLTFAILTGPANGSLGTLNANSGAVTYTPSGGYAGLDSFTFTVFDGALYATGTVSITVLPATFGLRQGTNVFNPQTGLYEQLVSVTNLSGSTVAAFQLLVGDFASTNGTPRTNVWLWNASGTNFDGRRYVQYNAPLDPGSNATVRLEFYNPTRVPFTNSLEVQATLPAPAITNLSGGVAIDVAFADNRIPGDPRFVIEWTSVPGGNYTVIYGSSPNGPWTAATPTVNATATRTQWYDDGPPKTASEPLSGSRYYRVIHNNP